jgi:hypothetical protein
MLHPGRHPSRSSSGQSMFQHLSHYRSVPTPIPSPRKYHSRRLCSARICRLLQPQRCKAAINAPLESDWQACTTVNVFANAPTRTADLTNADSSLGPAQNGILSRLIEKTGNVIIGNGDLDMLHPTNGTLFAIQNMTWGGHQGFSVYPNQPLFVPHHQEHNNGAFAGAGVLGRWTTERGLVTCSTNLSTRFSSSIV